MDISFIILKLDYWYHVVIIILAADILDAFVTIDLDITHLVIVNLPLLPAQPLTLHRIACVFSIVHINLKRLSGFWKLY